MIYDDTGTLSIRTIIAGGALPLENTLVNIKGADEENSYVEYSLITDRDGITSKVTLPAPAKRYSLSPGAAEKPYATYDITVRSAGYYSKIIRGVAIFSGTDAVQLISMIPLVEDENITLPKGNLTAFVEENEDLE